MAFLLNKTALSKLRLNPQKTDESLMLSRRGIHIEPGAREKALLAADPSLKRFKSHKQSVRTLKRVGDVLTIVVVAASFYCYWAAVYYPLNPEKSYSIWLVLLAICNGCCYEIYVRAVMREEARKQAAGSA